MYTMETERLLLRPWGREDLAAFFEYASQEDVGPAAGWTPHRTLEESLAVLEAVHLSNPRSWAIVRKGTQRPIGSISLRQDEKRPSSFRALAVGYSLSHHHWGNGYATEATRRIIIHAFHTLHSLTLACYHYPENHRSQHVIEKCGFHYEGRIRLCAQMQLHGKILTRDELCYSMTDAEFNQLYDGATEQ